MEKESDIQKELSNIGIKYTHRDQDLVKENAIEAQRLDALIKKKKQARREAKAKAKKPAKDAKKASSPEPQWPPKRKHHKPAPTPGEK